MVEKTLAQRRGCFGSGGKQAKKGTDYGQDGDSWVTPNPCRAGGSAVGFSLDQGGSRYEVLVSNGPACPPPPRAGTQRSPAGHRALTRDPGPRGRSGQGKTRRKDQKQRWRRGEGPGKRPRTQDGGRGWRTRRKAPRSTFPTGCPPPKHGPQSVAALLLKFWEDFSGFLLPKSFPKKLLTDSAAP